MPAVTPFLIACLAAYLIGSIPFGYLIGKAHGVDIRAQGSGNIGATNLGRIVGKFWGQLCFLLDLGKGAGPVLAYGAYAGVLGNLDTFRGLPPTPEEQPGSMGLLFWITVGMCAVLGHIFPIYLRFRGGKGVATGFGVMLGMWPQLTAPAFGALFVWYVTLKLSRYVGIASCAAAASLPFWYILWRIPRAHGVVRPHCQGSRRGLAHHRGDDPAGSAGGGPAPGQHQARPGGDGTQDRRVSIDQRAAASPLVASCR